MEPSNSNNEIDIYFELWKMELELLKSFIDKNKRVPSIKSKNPEEKQLAKFMKESQKKYGR